MDVHDSKRDAIFNAVSRRAVVTKLRVNRFLGPWRMSHLQCLMCEHYQFSKRCAAYPEKVPSEIISGHVDHSEPYAGDNGITFKELNVSSLETKFPDTSEKSYGSLLKQMKAVLEIPLPPQFMRKRRGRPRAMKKGE